MVMTQCQLTAALEHLELHVAVVSTNPAAQAFTHRTRLLQIVTFSSINCDFELQAAALLRSVVGAQRLRAVSALQGFASSNRSHQPTTHVASDRVPEECSFMRACTVRLGDCKACPGGLGACSRYSGNV